MKGQERQHTSLTLSLCEISSAEHWEVTNLQYMCCKKLYFAYGFVKFLKQLLNYILMNYERLIPSSIC